MALGSIEACNRPVSETREAVLHAPEGPVAVYYRHEYVPDLIDVLAIMGPSDDSAIGS